MRIVREAHRDRRLRLDEIARASGSCRCRPVRSSDIDDARARRQDHRRASRRRCPWRPQSASTSRSRCPDPARPWRRPVSISWWLHVGIRAADAGRTLRGSARWPRRRWRGQPGMRLPARRPAPASQVRKRLRSIADRRSRAPGARLMAATCAGVACFGAVGGVVPEAAGIDDVGRRLRFRVRPCQRMMPAHQPQLPASPSGAGTIWASARG